MIYKVNFRADALEDEKIHIEESKQQHPIYDHKQKQFQADLGHDHSDPYESLEDLRNDCLERETKERLDNTVNELNDDVVQSHNSYNYQQNPLDLYAKVKKVSSTSVDVNLSINLEDEETTLQNEQSNLSCFDPEKDSKVTTTKIPENVYVNTEQNDGKLKESWPVQNMEEVDKEDIFGRESILKGRSRIDKEENILVSNR